MGDPNPVNDESLKEAEENLNRYFKLADRMYDRIQQDPEGYASSKRVDVSDPQVGKRQTK
jgi:hypothetical protein